MITTRLMLESLRSWVQVHRDSLDRLGEKFPYQSYLISDAHQSLRRKVTDITDHIVSLIGPYSTQKETKI
jgi:hypothetical protein